MKQHLVEVGTYDEWSMYQAILVKDIIKEVSPDKRVKVIPEFKKWKYLWLKKESLTKALFSCKFISEVRWCKKKKGGRPNKYEIHVEPRLIEIESWARDGQIAKNLGVAYSNFREYKKKYLALSVAIKRGKEIIDREVENAMLKRALGYEYEEVTQERVIKKDAKGDVMTDSHGFLAWYYSSNILVKE